MFSVPVQVVMEMPCARHTMVVERRADFVPDRREKTCVS